MTAPWTFDAETHEPLGPASARLADVAGIHQHVGCLWAYERDGEWHHFSRVIQADAAFAVQARNVYVEALRPETAIVAAACALFEFVRASPGTSLFCMDCASSHPWGSLCP